MKSTPKSANKIIELENFLKEMGNKLKVRPFVYRKQGLSVQPQDHYDLLKYHLENNTFFEDSTFGPGTEYLKSCEWKRPKEIIENPKFISDGANRFDVKQGELGDSLLLAAIASLTLNKKLLEFVVPPEQDFEENYVGIFHFRFWHYGHWVDVVIDDRLPTIDNKLCYLKSDDPTEFWKPLLEKAYAKLYGSYSNINGGFFNEVLEDLTGGFSEVFEPSHPQVFEIMELCYEQKSFMGGSIMIPGKHKGLGERHAYSITKVIRLFVPKTRQEVKLVRIRNPWGDATEWTGLDWTGTWSDSSENWNEIPKHIKDKQLCKDSDGEFWMQLKFFQRYFTHLNVCHWNTNEVFHQHELDNKRWHFQHFDGSWIRNLTAGGGLHNFETFIHNPQYFFTIQNDGSDNLKYAVVIGLMHKFRRELGESHRLSLSLVLYAVSDKKVLDLDFVTNNPPIEHLISKQFSRQITLRTYLPRGTYCIIPCDSCTYTSGDFLIRFMSEIDGHLMENEGGHNNILWPKITDVGNYEEILNDVIGNDRELDWQKTYTFLNEFFLKLHQLPSMEPLQQDPVIKFSKESCRTIVSLWDRNGSGKLDSKELLILSKDIIALKKLFLRFDKDKSDKLSGFEFMNLLKASGYKLNTEIVRQVMIQYSSDNHPMMKFEDFVVCAFKINAHFNK